MVHESLTNINSGSANFIRAAKKLNRLSNTPGLQLESLFIDEGFSSLLPTTFNIAIDALERFHNQGRKVGGISNVQEMTERIPVQIKVSKEHSGKSRVEVIGS